VAEQKFEPNVDDFLKEARTALAEDEWERARECALKVLAFEPENKYATSILAAAKQLPVAVDPAPVARLLQQAIAYLDAQDWDRASERAIAVRALDPHNVDAERIIEAADKRGSLQDPQTGQSYKLHFEDRFAAIVANVSFAYLLAALVFIIWMAVDTLLRKNTMLVSVFGYHWDSTESNPLNSNGYRLLAMTAIAGAFGGTLDAIRSLVRWHSEADSYGPRFLPRDIGMPWIGGTIGLIVYVLVRSGAGLLNGDFTLDESNPAALTSSVAIGFLGGFSSIQVYKWIDATANNIFSTVRPAEAAKPEAAEATEPV
jgi:tetratricopeptide (TPR) repeat protein